MELDHLYSTPAQMGKIKNLVCAYMRLPFSTDAIPGAVMEAALAYVKGGEVLKTYDFIDVLDRKHGIGWQVKATKVHTPVTWKRAKLEGREGLILQSKKDPVKGLPKLGSTIIEFCNKHVYDSIKAYDLKYVLFSRLIILNSTKAKYYERLLVTAEEPRLFDPEDFKWEWSTAKKTTKKEQLQALHGRYKDGKKYWAWHGLGENQLHFSGESAWWPKSKQDHFIDFDLPTENDKMTVEEFVEMLSTVSQ
jgi:hypothetical protein